VLHLNELVGKNIKISNFDRINSSDGSSANTAQIIELYYQRSFLNNKIIANFKN